MQISDFARQTGLSVDTVRYYIRCGLLAPEMGRKGGRNPYQIFSAAHVNTARQIKLAKSLGFSLAEIAALADAYHAGNAEWGAAILKSQMVQLEQRSAHLAQMMDYMQRKITWLELGGIGDMPQLAP